MSYRYPAHDTRSDAPCQPGIVGLAIVRELASSVRDYVRLPFLASVGITIHVSPLSPDWLRIYEDESGKHAAQP
jgi:hypothetical protein